MGRNPRDDRFEQEETEETEIVVRKWRFSAANKSWLRVVASYTLLPLFPPVHTFLPQPMVTHSMPARTFFSLSYFFFFGIS